MDWEMWKEESQMRIQTSLSHYSLPINKKYVEHMSERTILKLVYDTIYRSEQYAALTMIRKARRELDKFTQEVVSGR